ncbi:MAG: hypothetical protein LBQ93_03280 [Treponema sp.]|jgi:hypothetical protein|nr:hypothetical protein [Treponema sp.]
MRKIVILWIMFFTIFSYTFADENLIELGNISFRLQSFIYQSFIYQNNNQNIDFTALNPMFFYNGNEYFQKNIFENNRLQNTQEYTNFQSNNSNIFGSLIFSLVLDYARSSMYRDVYNNRWEQQVEEERMYRRLFHENRNFYGIYSIK